MSTDAKQLLYIAIAAVLAIVLPVVAMLAWFGHQHEDRLRHMAAQAAAFCEPIAVGSDYANVASAPHAPREPVRAASGTLEYRFSFLGPAYETAQCRLTVDAHGKVVAKRAGRTMTLAREDALAASAAAGR